MNSPDDQFGDILASHYEKVAQLREDRDFARKQCTDVQAVIKSLDEKIVQLQVASESLKGAQLRLSQDMSHVMSTLLEIRQQQAIDSADRRRAGDSLIAAIQAVRTDQNVGDISSQPRRMCSIW